MEDVYFTDVTLQGHSLILSTFPWRRSACPWVVTSGDESVRTCRVGVPREWPRSRPPAGCFLQWPWSILAQHRLFHSPDDERISYYYSQFNPPSYLETWYFLEKILKRDFKVWNIEVKIHTYVKKECLGVPMHFDIIDDQDTKYLLHCINSTI